MLHFSEALIAPGLPPREQHRVGRARLPGTSFATIVRDVRQTLAGILGPAGFDPARDIAAITVNRWPHGCACGYNPLFDPDYGRGKAPHEIGRQTFGNIAIAYSDARACLDAAIDQACRAIVNFKAKPDQRWNPACGNPQHTFSFLPAHHNGSPPNTAGVSQ